MPLFKAETLESESEIDYLPVHSKNICNILRRKVSHNPNFGLCQDDTDGSFKIGLSSFKYIDIHVFLDGKKYKATQDLWEFFAKSLPDKNLVTLQDRHA